MKICEFRESFPRVGYRAMARRQTLPVKSSKSFQLKGSQHEATILEEKFTQQLELLTRNADAHRKSASLGKWLSSRKLVQVNSPKGNIWSTHGHVSGGDLFLDPLEALYLLEHGNLVVTNNDHVMTLEEGYMMILSGGLSLEHYQVYGHLKRVGFIVYLSYSQSDKRKILEVYKHCKNFKKTQLGTPYGRVLVVRPSDPFPDRSQLIAMETPSSMLLYAVVDNSGNVAYYKIQTGSIQHLSSFY